MKKFLKFLVYILVFAQRGEVGESEAELGGLEKYLDDANLPGAEENTEPENSEQPQNEDSTKEKEGKEDDLESLLKGFAPEEKKGDESETPTADLVELLNKEGVLHNGLPVEFKDVDQIKELVSKGYDYTHKTQEAAEQRKVSEQEFAEKEKAFNEREQALTQKESELGSVTQENQIIIDVLKELRNEDPDFVDAIADKVDQRLKLYNQSINNPAVLEMKEKYAELEKQINGNKEETENKKTEAIKNEWETSLKTTQQEYGAKLHALGVKPNWDQVHKRWQADNDGKMTAKDALFAVHGEQITKALLSEKKLAEQKAQSLLRTGGGDPIQSTTEKDNEKESMDELDLVINAAKKLAV